MSKKHCFTDVIAGNEAKFMYEVDPKCYKMTVQEFLEVVEDAKTHGMSIHYIGGKLYYTYDIWC